MTTTKYGRSKKYNRVYGEALVTPAGRFSWPCLTEPKAPPPPRPGEAPGQPRYECQLLIANNPGDPVLTQFLQRLDVMAKEMLEIYNTYAQAKLASVDLFKDGNAFDLEKYPYYKDQLLFVGRHAEKIKVLGADKKELDASFIEAGMQGRFVIVPHLGATGLSYRLERVQFLLDDGTRFGGGRREYDSLLDAVESEPDPADAALDEAPPAAPVAPAPNMRAQIAAQKGGKGKAAAVNLL